MWKEIPPFSFSAGERKLMAHFVVKFVFASLVAALSRWDLRGKNYPFSFGCGLAALCLCDSPCSFCKFVNR